MSPEEYERLKKQEKEHLKKLKELKDAVRVLERQKKIQSTLAKISRDSADALDTQNEMVERLALETAMHEARLDVALDSVDRQPAPENLEEDLQRERAQALVEQIRHSMDSADDELGASADSADELGGGAGHAGSDASRHAEERSAANASQTDHAGRGEGEQKSRGEPPHERGRRSAREKDGDPTQDRERPEKTIGRM